MKAIQLVPAMEEGGVERYVVRLNAILSGAGWENVVVSRGGKLDAEIEKGGGRVVHQEMKSKNPLTALGRAWRVRALLKREKPDVVCAHSRIPAWLFVLASHGLGIRWMTYAHGANSISRYSRVMTKGDLIMCPSNFIREYLTKAYGVDGSRFRVVPHGIDAGRFDPEKVDVAFVEDMKRTWGIGPDTKVVMSIGRITRIKGFDTLIRAVAQMRGLGGLGSMQSVPSKLPKPSKPSLKLIIVGGAEKGKEAYLDELKALACKLGMEQAVVFAGQQSKTPECLSIADVVVSANTKKPESFGLSMAEALMMGKPVVAKAFGGALDIVRDGVDGILVRAGEKDESGEKGVVEAFAEAITKAFTVSPSHHLTFDAIRAAARERFDFGIMAARTLAVYEEAAR